MYSFYSEEEFPALPFPSISPDANAEDDETDDDGFAALDDAKAIRVVFLSLVFVWRERRAFVNS